MVPCSVCFVGALAIPYFFLSKSKETPMTQLEMLRAFKQPLLHLRAMFVLIVFDLIVYVVEHRHGQNPSFDIARFRGTQECSNVSHDLGHCVAWKIYQRNCTGLPVRSYLSMYVVGSHTSESLVVHAWIAMAVVFPIDNTESENTCTSVLNRFPFGDSN